MTTQTNSPEIRPAPAFARVALASAATAAALIALGYWPTVTQAGSAGINAMLAGIGVALLGGWAGSAPTVAYLAKPAQQHPIGILIGLGVRFGVTIGLTLVVWLSGAFPRTPLLLWVGIAQLVVLAVDVVGLVGLLKRAAREES